ncbi:MAG: hypothetical protein KDA61_03770, partial [Planctomycetales bacterium]|nr:hypothetical protein [Planctomycetales bacterium]
RNAKRLRIAEMQRVGTIKLRDQVSQLETQREREIKRIKYEKEQKIRSVQDFYKLCSILLPPTLPLLLAVLVYFRRREAERQGVARERLR